MAGCLRFLVFAVLLVFVLAWFVPPLIAGPVVATSLTAAGFDGEDTEVVVRTDPPPELVLLHADNLRITSRNVRRDDVRIQRLDLQLTDVGLLDRTFASIEGTLDGLSTLGAGGEAIVVQRISIDGESPNPAATVEISPAQVQSLAADAIAGLMGTRPTTLSLLEPDGLQFVVGPATTVGRFEIEADGSLALAVAGGPLGDQNFVLIRPQDGLPVAFRSLRVGPTGLVLEGTLEVAALGL